MDSSFLASFSQQERTGQVGKNVHRIRNRKTHEVQGRAIMQPPDLQADDWHTKRKEDLEMERRQLLLFAASITDLNKQGPKHHLVSLATPWQDVQDLILELDKSITP